MKFDYFYNEQSESYSFYRTPKVFFTDDRFRCLSSDAKILYGILLDRVSLSARNKWIDEQGRIFVYMTISSIEKSIGRCHQKSCKLLDELERIGLIERVKQGQGKPTRIYVNHPLIILRLIILILVISILSYQGIMWITIWIRIWMRETHIVNI